MTTAELFKLYPAPWTHVVEGQEVVVKDNDGMKVPLFTLLDFVCKVTTAYVKK